MAMATKARSSFWGSQSSIKRKDTGIHMMTDGKNIDWSNSADKLTKKLNLLQKNLSPTQLRRKVFKPLGELIVRRIQTRFEFGGMMEPAWSNPAKWPPLSEATILNRRYEGIPESVIHRPKIRSGELISSIKVYKVSQRTNVMTIGSFLPYAQFQEFGGVTTVDQIIKGKHLDGRITSMKIPAGTETPPRPAIFFGPTLLGQIHRWLDTFIEQELKFSKKRRKW